MSQPPHALDPRPPQSNLTALRRRVRLEPVLYHLRTLAIRAYSLDDTGGLRPG